MHDTTTGCNHHHGAGLLPEKFVSSTECITKATFILSSKIRENEMPWLVGVISLSICLVGCQMEYCLSYSLHNREGKKYTAHLSFLRYVGTCTTLDFVSVGQTGILFKK